MPGTSSGSQRGKVSTLGVLVGSPIGTSFAANMLTMLVCQAVATGLAMVLDVCGFKDATIVIVFVLGVLVTAMLTTGQAYSMAASVVSIICYNFFLIEPRLSLRIDRQEYAGTITAMLAFALLASYLVISQRRSAQQSMEASLIAQREQLRANMLRSVSHDLRTPLTSITGNADMLLDEEAHLSDGTRRQLIVDIYDDATWLSNVVQNLLAVTRLEDGNVQLDTELEVVDDVIEEAMRHVSRDACKHQLIVEPSSELLMARMDPQVIVQVIVNLVNNAITHTQDGSTIIISSAREGDYVAISVSDNGPGVPDAAKEQVFEPFYSDVNGDADSSRSIGLGLALCRSIINAHGGSIRVEDADPHGSRFVFTLPVEEVNQHA